MLERRRIARALRLHRPAEEPVHRQPLRGGLDGWVKGCIPCLGSDEGAERPSWKQGESDAAQPRPRGAKTRERPQRPRSRFGGGQGLPQPAHGEDQRDRSRKSWSEAKGQAPPCSELHQPRFAEREEGPIPPPDDDVVEDFDVEDLTRLHELESVVIAFAARLGRFDDRVIGKRVHATGL